MLLYKLNAMPVILSVIGWSGTANGEASLTDVTGQTNGTSSDLNWRPAPLELT